MNEEERKCLNDCGFSNVTQLLLAYVSLQQENHKYKEVIDKAIEYLETATIDLQSMLHYRNYLLEILKGDNNE